MVNISSIIIICTLYSYGLILIYITYQTKEKGEKGSFINNLANTVIFLLSITLNLIITKLLNPLKGDFVMFPFDVLMILFTLIYVPVFAFLLIKERRKVKYGLKKPKIDNSSPTDLPLKYDIYRKLTHLVVVGFVFLYLTLGFLISDLTSKNLLIYTQNLVIFLVGISLIGLLTADFIRILVPRYYPLKLINQILKEKELHMRLGPHICMGIGCFSIILLYGFIQPFGIIIICTSMIMAVFGDVAANLIGRTKGKRKIRNTPKTYEGLFAGIASAFISGFIMLLLLKNIYTPKNYGVIIIPTIGALMIGFIDFINLEIDDNLTYNFIISTCLFFISLLLF
ncbi:MAG: phosphatidate cytidylyltransferase [Promethearchaeota archaeon]|jgi:dolichol kinase